MRAIVLFLSISLVGCASSVPQAIEASRTQAVCDDATSNDGAAILHAAVATEPLRRGVHPNTTMTETRGVRVLVLAERGHDAAYLERALSCAVAEAPAGHPLDGVESVSVRARGPHHEIELETATGSAGRILRDWLTPSSESGRVAGDARPSA